MIVEIMEQLSERAAELEVQVEALTAERDAAIVAARAERAVGRREGIEEARAVLAAVKRGDHDDEPAACTEDLIDRLLRALLTKEEADG